MNVGSEYGCFLSEISETCRAMSKCSLKSLVGFVRLSVCSRRTCGAIFNFPQRRMPSCGSEPISLKIYFGSGCFSFRYSVAHSAVSKFEISAKRLLKHLATAHGSSQLVLHGSHEWSRSVTILSDTASKVSEFLFILAYGTDSYRTPNKKTMF